MSVNNGIVTAPIRIEELYTLFGLTPAQSGGKYDVAYLCSNQHGKIKPMARYKPVRHSGVGASVPSASSYNSKWWRAADGNCGFLPKALGSNYKDIVNYCSGGLNGWVYQPPVDGWPFRLTDLCGYNRDAEPFIYAFQAYPNIAPTGTVIEVMTDASESSDGSNDTYTDLTKPPEITSLSLSDFEALKDSYFGVYMTSGTQWRRLTAESPLSAGSNSLTISIPTTGLVVGEWKIYPFLANAKIGIDGNDSSTWRFWSIPYAPTLSVQIISSALYIYVAFDEPFTGASGNYKINIVINNQTSNTVRCQTNMWKVRFPDKDMYDDGVVGETQGTIPDFDVPPKSELIVPATVQVSAAVAATGAPMLLVTLGKGVYTLYTQFDDDRGEESTPIN